jgi:pimeloyl-ACP methyl ester carboxylesterase
MKLRGARRFREQKWLLDSVISTTGLDWDLLRMSTVTAPIGFEGMGDWALVAAKAKRFDDISPSFEEVAAGRQARAQEAEASGNEVTARESYLVASIYYGVAQWPIDEVNERNLALNARKLDCYARYAARAPQNRTRRDCDGRACCAGVAAPSARRQAALPAGGDAAGHGHVQGETGLGLRRQDARTRLCRFGHRRSRPIRGLDARAQSDRRQFRRRRPRLSFLDRHAQGYRPRPHRRFGRSFGSYAATVFANAIAERLRGVVVGLPCFEPGFNRIFEEASPTYKSRFMFMAGYEDEAEFDTFIQGFDLRSRVGNLRCPFMVLGGELDELAPIQHVFEVCKKVPGPCQIVVYQNERHAPGRLPSSQIGPHWYTMMADWLTTTARDRRPFETSRYLYVTAAGKVEQREMG